MDKRPNRSVPSHGMNMQRNNSRVGDGSNSKNSINGMINLNLNLNLNLMQTPLASSSVGQKITKRNKVSTYSLKIIGNKSKVTNSATNNNVSSIGQILPASANSTNVVKTPESNLNLNLNLPNNNGQMAMSTNVVQNNGQAIVSPSNLKNNNTITTTTTSTIRIKNEEAVNDLRQRIPEIEKIFDVHTRVGNGTFSTVLLGTLKKERHLEDGTRRKFAIKHHIPTNHPERIMRELQCMANIGGVDNVAGVNCCMRCNDSVAFIMPYMPHDRFRDYFNKMDVEEVQFYMKNLLLALRRVHRYNVIHRDVKPSNFLYNRNKREFLLVDFGLAHQAPAKRTKIQSSCVSKKLSQKLSGIGGPAIVGSTTTGEGNQQKAQNGQNDGDDRDGIKSCLHTVTESKVLLNDVSKKLHCTGPSGDQQLPAASGSNTKSDKSTTFKMSVKRSNNKTKMPGKKSSTITATNSNSNGNNNNNNNSNGLISLTQTTSAAGTTTGSSNNKSKKNNSKRTLSAISAYKCFCYGNTKVCNICLIKKEIHAARAGTPGYRPPEVLLLYADQTTAVDIWAVGVIFLSILSSVYPFFKAPNDFIALAEMVTLFGDESIRNTACILDRLITLSQHSKPLDLRKLCVRLRNRAKFSSIEMLKKHQKPDGTCEVCKNCDQYYFNCLCAESSYDTEPLDSCDAFPSSAYDLLNRLLEVNPHKRITAEEALKHEFFNELVKNECNEKTSNTNLAATDATFLASK